MDKTPEYQQALRDQARAFLQHVSIDPSVTGGSLAGKSAVAFVLPSGNVGSESADLYHGVMDQLHAAGGKVGKDFIMQIEEALKPGESRHEIVITTEYLDKAKGFKRWEELQMEREAEKRTRTASR